MIKQRCKAAALSSLKGKQSVCHDDESAIVEKNTVKKDARELHEETALAVNPDLSLADVHPLKPLVQTFFTEEQYFCPFLVW